MDTFSKRATLWCLATLAVVLVMAGVTLGQYEDSPRVPLDEELLYQENLNQEPGLRAGFGGIENALILNRELNRALMMNKIIQGAQMRSANPEEEDPGTISETIDYLDITRKMPGTIDAKDMVTKRYADDLMQRELRSGGTTSARPQQRWKNKKGKGNQFICYFKLCSFRTPS